MRTHRELVDQQPAVSGLEQLDGEDAGDVELGGDALGHGAALGVQRRVEIGGRRDDLGAHAVGLARLDDRVGHHLAGRRAGDERGQLPAEVDELLGQQDSAGREGLVRLGRRAHDPHALAVVAAAGGLDDGREAERLEVGERGDGGVARTRDAELAEPDAHGALVLGEQQGVRAGSAGVPLGLERPQVLGRHVLVVERDDRDVGDDGPQVVEVGVVADPVVGDDLGGRDVGALGEQPDADAEADGGLLHHAGELAAADDGQIGLGGWLRLRHASP